MKKLTGHHHINACNAAIDITATDPEPSGASTIYQLRVPDEGGYPSPNMLRFQNGPITVDDKGVATGVNGVTHEAVLEVLSDRFSGLQTGKFACEENARALELVEEIKKVLASRTHRRKEAGVEGSHTP